MSGLLVADTATESVDIDQLLDRPFDELTPLEWEMLKLYEPQPEDVTLAA